LRQQAGKRNADNPLEKQLPDGRFLEIRVGRLSGGGVVAMFTDVTGRREAEQQRQRSEALLKDAIGALDEAFVLRDPQDRVVYCNEKFRDMYAADEQPIAPGSSYPLLVAEAARRGRFPAAIGRVADWVSEHLARPRSANELRIVELDDGRIMRAIDRRTPDGYHVGVRVEITDLVMATNRAEASAKSKSRFLANMSHEIRTPMNAIIGMTGLVLETEINAEQRELLDIVRDSGDALLALINDILDFSKIEAGQLDLELTEFDLHDTIRQSAKLLMQKARDKDIALEFVIGRDVPRVVKGDAYRLRQVLLNLLSNAVKFTDHGWVLLSVAARPRSLPSQDAELEFRVRDTGTGIPAEKLKHIFQPFSQADDSITRRFGGTGLGLSICTELVSKMGGQLAVDSVDGEGSTFSFTVRMPESGEQAQRQNVQHVPVLVLDRSPLPDRTLLDCLKHWNLDARPARTPAQALTMLGDDGNRPDYVVVKSSWLGLASASQQEQISGHFDMAARILLMDTAIDSSIEKQFGHSLRWPGGTNSLYDALAVTVQNGAHTSGSPDQQFKEAVDTSSRFLLLVDDNPINRKLALRLLEGMGHRVAVATNGLEAVNFVTEQPVDMVLMDMQMPVMDGFEATARIREMEQGGERHTPIVAMTAHAMAEDKQRCADAGMDGHVSKPIVKQVLAETVARLALRSTPSPNTDSNAASATTQQTQASPNNQPQASDAAVTGLELINRAAALDQLGGDEELFDELCGMFVASLPEVCENLRKAATSQDIDQLGNLAHAQKGAAGAIAASQCRELAATLEQVCNSGDHEQATNLVSKLLDCMAAVGNEINQTVSQ
jgi:signal transduction histidine kinase/CheY-like chemotaxis protein/HPt (histidine-containing phosphotransfer) domain-containing protein